jgi:pimeloyl-ACP methyl ester carboxylesterase
MLQVVGTRVVVAGNSIGGFIAASMAADYPQVGERGERKGRGREVHARMSPRKVASISTLSRKETGPCAVG